MRTAPVVTAHSRSTGPVIRRSWRLAAAPEGPLLTGLYGFPWRDPLMQAKCTTTEPAGRADPFGAVRLDRMHPSVPSPDCRCGLYATNEPRPGWLQHNYLRHSIVVSGFVRLSGRVVRQGDEYRAEEALVVGPLAICLPAPGRIRRAGKTFGISQQIGRVVEDGGWYAVRYGSRGGGTSLGDWLRDTSAALRKRYGVGTVGVVPSVLGE